jgi:diadenosine tetraphosphatase ApaH/serine/threonine PP2A family protein phosphatase/Ca2+-binding EF-hand superfamily protein
MAEQTGPPNAAAHAMGLQEGYSQEQWGPWKSHGLLLQQAIVELQWQESAAALIKLFKEFSHAKEGYLNREEFIAVLQKYPCCNTQYHSVFFDLFDRNQDGFLNESDFLGGILAVSPHTPHKLEAPSGQLRMQFIFLYYDANRNGRLEVDEVAKMIEHIQMLRGQPHSDAMVDATALVSLYNGPFGFAAFYDSAQKRMLNGTSPLLRTQQDLPEAVRRQASGGQTSALPPAPASPLTAQSTAGPGAPAVVAPAQVTRQQTSPMKPARTDVPAEVTRSSSDSSPYGGQRTPTNIGNVSGLGTLAPQVRNGASGPPGSPGLMGAGGLQEAGPPAVPQMPGTSAGVAAIGQGVPGVMHPSPTVMRSTPANSRGAFGQGAQLDAQFWQQHPNQWDSHPPQGTSANSLALRIVRRLMELSNGPRTDWRYTLQLASSKEMLLLCDTVVEILRLEDSLVAVPLPCRVYGDIHGQLLDLLEFFNAFSWPDKRRGDIFSMNYVFLGDFVDRGNYSCDVISLLFSLKILYPTKIFLVRGNHEDRLMNVNYGFQSDCVRKFAHEGEDIWERVNDVFEFLPIAALVEGLILCIHGGIGDSISTLDDLRGIPKPIQVVGEITASTTARDRMILDALWSDPTDNDSVLGVHISPRGKNTCRFGPDRVQDFNRRNGLKLIIRAHECVQHGYEYFAHGQLLTVFSATNYCNQYNNDGAMVVLVKDDRTGEVVEHAQVIKSGTVDTSHGWNDHQFRAPSPMRRAAESGSDWS